jgi:Sodium:solute symporter family
VNLYTGALFIQQSLGWDLYLSILLQVGIVALLTITGMRSSDMKQNANNDATFADTNVSSRKCHVVIDKMM